MFSAFTVPSNEMVSVIRYVPTKDPPSGWKKKILKILRDDIGSHVMNYLALATLIVCCTQFLKKWESWYFFNIDVFRITHFCWISVPKRYRT
jgi:hypothetical protein